MSPANPKLRDALRERVIADLHGPLYGEQEELDGVNPIDQYILGVLAPKELTASADTEPDEQLGTVGARPPADEDTAGDDLPSADQLVPSALGLTVAVDPSVTELRVTARWACYRRGPSDERLTKSGDKPKTIRRRHPAGGTVRLALTQGSLGPKAPDAEHPEVVVTGLCRDRDLAGTPVRLVSIFLRNEQLERDPRDAAWLFQVELEITDPEGRAVFVRRVPPSATHAPKVDRDELAGLDLLYRDHTEFAVGHSTSVAVTGIDGRAARTVRTTSVPTAEVPLTEAPTPQDFADDPSIAEPFTAAAPAFDMRHLGQLDAEQLAPTLNPLVQAYRAWIERERGRAADPSVVGSEHADAVQRHLTECARVAERIEAGISALGDPLVAQAFQFANRAMWKQRIHTLAAEECRRDPTLLLFRAVERVDLPKNRTWRPFQLAFVLLNLPALADPTHPERLTPGLVDLLFFPTGGGKTEAYLGLTAFTLGYRRLTALRDGGTGDGVSVLMRYTLRLLTLQQFQRAAALICACEVERGAKPGTWGTTPFRIGLWVGANSTPNTTDKARDWLSRSKADGGRARSGSSPLQLKRCPWCGSEISIGKASISIVAATDSTHLYCSDDTGQCPFSRNARRDGLPAVVVDDEIYRRLPALVVATVDKFARMPWEGRTQALFGRVDRHCPRHGYLTSADTEHPLTHTKRQNLPAATVSDVDPLLPPDLIIQDELHLISGPLGTLVGLYETAIDELCSREVGDHVVRPKVIASTATIRRAGHQVTRLFGRELAVFPPPGIDARDNFFSLQRDRAGDPAGRQYVGICAPGRRFKQVLIRTYLAQLKAAWELGAADPNADAYMTVVGYFNSLRELGGMRRLVDDDVQNRLANATYRDGSGIRRNLVTEELTSRMGSEKIPATLDKLGVPFSYPQLGNDGKARWPRGDARWIDVLLATNMISVGVDVPRLGAMIVAGQPKSTSEYIQATSRVGRRDPGIVFTVYAWSKPRDLSHYERFTHYHATFYREVEALSVTPFSPRAIDRGIAGVLASLVRLAGPAAADNRSAASVPLTSSQVDELIDTVAASAAIKSGNASSAYVREALENKRDLWQQEQQVGQRTLGYDAPAKSGDVVALLQEPEAVGWRAWTVANSLRDVEASSGLSLRAGAMPPIDDDHPWRFGGGGS